MKANKAPEKLYLLPNGLISYCRNTDEDVEYTRTDAFIKKACDAYCKVCGHYAHTTPNHICRQACDYYKNFIKYMKRK
jgi:hypothetical protein